MGLIRYFTKYHKGFELNGISLDRSLPVLVKKIRPGVRTLGGFNRAPGTADLYPVADECREYMGNVTM